LLVKISLHLNPTLLDFERYTVMFNILRFVAKPEMSLSNKTEHKFLMKMVSNITKDFVVNITITEKQVSGDKEVPTEKPLKKKTKV
jgi:hypothetical protein